MAKRPRVKEEISEKVESEEEILSVSEAIWLVGNLPVHVSECALTDKEKDRVIKSAKLALIERIGNQARAEYISNELEEVYGTLWSCTVGQNIGAKMQTKPGMIFTLGEDTIMVSKDDGAIVVDEANLTLNGLQQFYISTCENRKINNIFDVLGTLEYNQVIVYTGASRRAEALHHVLGLAKFPTMLITSSLSLAERITRFQQFKDFKKRVLVTTDSDLFCRGIDIEKVNIVINFDIPTDPNCYLRRVGRAGRVGTKGLAITFSSPQSDAKILNEIQKRFKVTLTEAPPLDQINTNTYMNA